MRLGFDDPAAERAFWIDHVRTRGMRLPVAVIDRIRDLDGEVDLARVLRSDDAAERERASAALWVLWYRAAGDAAETWLAQAVRAMEAGEYRRAIRELSVIVERFPDYAEAWNKRATAYFLAGLYEEAVRDCEAAILRNPIHFGAWHGLGLCFLKLERPHEALLAFHRAHAIQPHADANRKALQACREQLDDDDDIGGPMLGPFEG